MQNFFKNKTVIALRKLITKILVITGIVFLTFHYVIGIFTCDNDSMYPSICMGDLLLTYRFTGYYHDDIVVYRHDGKVNIGRVVGVANDVIDIDESGLIVNDISPFESVFYDTVKRESPNVTYPTSVNEGEVFILADMRENGIDSRDYGKISISELEGKVVLIARRLN